METSWMEVGAFLTMGAGVLLGVVSILDMPRIIGGTYLTAAVLIFDTGLAGNLYANWRRKRK